MNAPHARTIPPLPLAALTLAALLVHAALLQLAPASFSFDEPLEPRRMLARGIMLQPLATQLRAAPTVPGETTRPHSAPRATQHEGAAASDAGSPTPGAPLPEATPAQASASAPDPMRAASALVASSGTAAGAGSATPADAPPAPDVLATGAWVGPGAIAAAASAQGVPPALAPDAAQRPAHLLLPGSIRLTYRVAAERQGVPLNASAELLWRHDGRQYEATFRVGNFLRSRVQTSRGAVSGQGLMPDRFSDKSGSERAAHFERGADGQGGHVVFSANSPTAALAPLAQDRLSVLLQLAAMLAGEPTRYGAGSAISLQVVGAREAEVWVFKVEGMEALDLARGSALETVQTVKLTRHPRREYDQKVEVWLGIAMGYLPARIRITEPNGNLLDQKLEKSETP